MEGHPHRFGDMLVTEETCRRLLSIPMYPELTDEQIEYVAANVKDFLCEASPAPSPGVR